MLVMALDVGTSSARAACFDAAACPLPGAEGRVAFAPRTAADGTVEFDPDALVDAVAAAVNGCLAGAGAGAAETTSVGASVFWHSLLALDGAGRPLTPLLTWADTRSAAAAAALRARLDARATHARTGAPLHAAFYPARLAWLRASRPDVFARAATWCGFAEYLLARLTGTLRVSVSMASGTGLLDQEALAWDAPLLAESAIGEDRLPAIGDAPARGLTGEWAARWPALAGIPWFPGWGDGGCSNLGSDCAGPERIALNVGTSAALRLVTPNVAALPNGLWRYRIDAARSLVGGATSEGGNVFAWCRERLALPEASAFEDALARRAPDSHRLTTLPFLIGERSPGWRADARAAITGLSLATDAVDVAAALLEGVALRLSLVYERLAPLAGAGHEVIASGGALRSSPAWTRMLADAIGRPLTLSAEVEASSRGAALRTLEALGAPVPPPAARGRVIAPDLDRHAAFRAARERQGLLYDNVVGPSLS
jgi:gluconokinase